MSPASSPDDRHPAGDGSDPSDRLSRSENLYREFLSRQKSGEDVDAEAYLKKYPELEEDLKILFDRLKDRHALDSSLKEGEERIIGDFKIFAEIGRGAMGVVYEAEQISLHRRVALKVIASHLRYSDDAMRRFQREAEALARQHHPGVVAVYAVGKEKGIPYIAQELVEGSYTLSDRLSVIRAQGQQPPGYFRDVAMLVCETAEALQHAHDRGVIHRDIKPSNILLTKEGHPKITDFGLARVEDALGLSRTGDFAGTPYYMSPEQAMARRMGIDHRTDVYSLGVTLYEMLCQKRPFEGKTSHDVLRQIILIDPHDPHKANPKVPRDLSTICLKAMEKHPENRYQTMKAFSDDLDRFLSGDVILAKPAGLGTRLWKRAKRHPVVSTALVAAFLALLAFAVVVPWIIAMKDREKKEAYDRITKLSTLKLLSELRSDEGKLWPALPENIDALEEWKERADHLLSRLDEFRRDLDELRREALPYDDEARKRYRERHAEWGDLLVLRRERDQIEEKIAALEGGDPAGPLPEDLQAPEDLAQWKKERDRLELKIGEIEERIDSGRSWEFDDLKKKWWHDMLSELVSGLEALTRGDRCSLKSVDERLDFARTVQRMSIDEHREAWNEAMASIGDEEACPMYRGLAMGEQIGFVPIGRDPGSGLWELAHLQTGAIPERDDRGEILLTSETGMVFVLIPGGTFRMGAVRPSPENPPGSPNTDPMADELYESPVHEVAVEPFFLSKYEMTQGQWWRFRYHNPSLYRDGDSYGTTWLHPVEYVSWLDATQRLRQFDLRLPTEAEWEYACRGGTTTAFWTGVEPISLQGAANLLDATFREGESRPWREVEDRLNDGHRIHAPVGRFLPNPFGLHDVHGNVYEWCQDAFVEGYRDAPADGSAVTLYKATTRIYRGGSFMSMAHFCRASSRSYGLYTERRLDIGLRPARSLR